MEKKKKDNKNASATIQEPETNNDVLSEEDQNQGARIGGKNSRTGSPLHDNAPSQNQQYPPIFQWPYAPQSAMEQSPLISKPSIPTVSPTPIVLSGWQQLPQQQSNSTNHQAQQGQPPLQLAQPTEPFWMSQRPGYHFVGAATYQPFTPLRTTDAGWQASSRPQPTVPSFCYHAGYPYPGFPGLWDPSSWWGQAQQSQPPCTYTFPGACGTFSSSKPLPMPGCSAASGQSFQRGIIRPSVKLSQKHQQLWEAQSAENVQLWMMIGQLQSELMEYKNRIMDLEAEVSSLKPTVEEAATQGTKTSLHGQTSKKGRPKRPIASVGALPSPDESHPRARGRKPALCKVQSETKALNFEKENLNKVEDNEKACHPPTTIQQENDQKIPNIFTNSTHNFEIHGRNTTVPAFHNQVHQNITGAQISGVRLNSSSEMKTNDDKVDDSKTAFTILSKHVKRNKSKGASATYIGCTNNGGLGWPSIVTSEDPARNGLHISSQGFFHNDSINRRGGKFVPRLDFVHEEDASGELDDAMVGSTKDEEDEEMEDDVSSGAKEIARNEDEDAYTIDGSGGTSPSGLPQLNSW